MWDSEEEDSEEEEYGQRRGKTRRGEARECVALLPFTTPVHDVGVAGGR